MAMSIREKMSYAEQKMSSMGLSPHQRAGIMGSIMGESGRSLDTTAHNPNDPNGGSFGITQVHSDRRTGLKTYAQATGGDVYDFKTQFDYAMEEAQTTHKKALEKVKAATTSAEAAKAWTNYFEKPAAKYANHAKRAANAKYYESVVQGGAIDPEDPGSLTGANTEEATPFGAIGTSITDIADSLLGTKEGDGVNSVNKGAKGGLSGMVGNFMGEANAGAKLGAIAGGVFGGPQGAVVGGLLGQGLGMMLQGIADNAKARAQAKRDEANKNYYPEGPVGGTNRTNGYGYSDLSQSGKNMYNSSPQGSQIRSAVDSKSPGLW